MSFQHSKWFGVAATGVLLSAGIVLVRGQVATKVGSTRAFVAGNFGLELDGKVVGYVRSVEGGHVVAEVVEERAGSTYFTKKHIGTPKYQELVIAVPFGVDKNFYNWIAASWSGNYQRKNGAVLFADYKLDTQRKLDFFNALVTETSIPECDASSKEPAYMSIKIAPEYTRTGTPAGKVSASKAEMWLPSNFKLDIGGTDCTRVNKIEAIVVKQNVASDAIGVGREAQKTPGKLEFPNLVFYVSEAFAKSFYDWHEDFVIKGNNSDAKERTGSLTLLDATRQKTLLTVKFFNLGIMSVAPEKTESRAEMIRRARVELYCERMEFIPGS